MTNSSAKWFLALGGINAAVAVALGAAGTHLLKGQLAVSDPAGWFAVALQYHQYHALGLILVGIAALRSRSSRWFTFAGILMLLGIAFFCGNLYWLSLVGNTPLHLAIPVGGAAFIAAWLLFSIGGFGYRYFERPVFRMLPSHAEHTVQTVPITPMKFGCYTSFSTPSRASISA